MRQTRISTDRPRTFGLCSLALFVVALICPAVLVLYPWPSPLDPFFLRPRLTIAEYHFRAVPLGAKIASTLATTNLLNGHFFDARSNRVSVFCADWPPGQGTPDNVLGHSPELCWIGMGFNMLHLGEPDQVTMILQDRPIQFTCRVLRQSGLAYPEITVWATNIGGIWENNFINPRQDKSNGLPTLSEYINEIVVIAGNRWTGILRLIRHPNTQNVRKQFIRLSKPLNSDPSAALRELEQFAGMWLQRVDPNEVLYR